MAIVWETDHHAIYRGGEKVELAFTKTIDVANTAAQIEDALKKATENLLAARGLPYRVYWHILSKSPLNYVLRVCPEGTVVSPDWWVVPTLQSIAEKET